MESVNSNVSFEPKILGFCCNWCSYAGADLAGVSRIQYAPNIRIIRVMCSGRVDPIFVFDAFSKGIDGVLVLGCHLGDCHYIRGNYEAINMINVTAKVLEHIGINSKRLVLDWVSASEGARFAEVVTKFTQQIRELGPLGIAEGKSDEEMEFGLSAAKMAVQGEKLRWVASKQTEFMTHGNKYGELFTRHEMNRVLEGVIIDEVAISKILSLLEEKPLSVKEISERVGQPPPRALRYVLGLRRKGLVGLDRVEGSSPLYTLQTGGRGQR